MMQENAYSNYIMYYYVHDFREETDPEQAALSPFCQKLVFWASLHFVDPIEDDLLLRGHFFIAQETSAKPNLIINFVSDVFWNK